MPVKRVPTSVYRGGPERSADETPAAGSSVLCTMSFRPLAVTFQAEAGCHARDLTGDQRWQDILGRVLPDIGNDSISCQDITSADGRRCSLSFLPSPDPSPVPSPQSGPLMTRKTLHTVTSLPRCASTRKTGSRTGKARLFPMSYGKETLSSMILRAGSVSI